MHLERTPELCRGPPLGIQHRNDQHDYVRKLPKVGKGAMQGWREPCPDSPGVGNGAGFYQPVWKKLLIRGRVLRKVLPQKWRVSGSMPNAAMNPLRKEPQNIYRKRNKGMKTAHENTFM